MGKRTPSGIPGKRLVSGGVFLGLVLVTLTPAAGRAPAWPLWQAFKARFVTYDGRVIVRKERDLRTVSEGQAYALFFALVADDRPVFERLLGWTRRHLAAGDLARNLPAWWWGRHTNGRWGVKERRSAADADLWIAYTLIQAARLWRVPGWRREGLALARLIASREVVRPRPGLTLLLGGDKGFVTHEGYLFNPSYPALPLLLALARAAPRGPWSGLARELPAQLAAVCRNGLCPDWALWLPGFGYGLPLAREGMGSWDAIRVYLWAGISAPASPGYRAVLRATDGMGRYLRRRDAVPLQINIRTGRGGGGQAPVGFLAAILPDLKALGERSVFASLRARLAAFRVRDGLYARPPGYLPRYYQNVLVLFALGFLDGRYRFADDGHLVLPWYPPRRWMLRKPAVPYLPRLTQFDSFQENRCD